MGMNMYNDRGHILAMLNVKRDEPLERAFGDIYENSPHTFLVPNLRRLSKEIGREIEAKYPRLNDLDSFKTYAELNTYVTQDMYMPDIKPSMYLASATEIKYNPVRLAFIGY